MFYLLSFEEINMWSDDDYLKVFDDLNAKNLNELPPKTDDDKSNSTITTQKKQTNISIPEEDTSKVKQISAQAIQLARNSIFRAILGVLLWLFGFSVIFYLTEPNFSYFDSFYYTFVTITAIGFGDYQVTTPISKELWWIFLFNAISVLSYCVGVAGKIISIRLNENALMEQGLKYRAMLKNRLAKFKAKKLVPKNRRLSLDSRIPHRIPKH